MNLTGLTRKPWKTTATSDRSTFRVLSTILSQERRSRWQPAVCLQIHARSFRGLINTILQQSHESRRNKISIIRGIRFPCSILVSRTRACFSLLVSRQSFHRRWIWLDWQGTHGRRQQHRIEVYSASCQPSWVKNVGLESTCNYLADKDIDDEYKRERCNYDERILQT